MELLSIYARLSGVFALQSKMLAVTLLCIYEDRMNQDVGRSRALRWILLSALAAMLLLAVGVFWGANNRARPQSIVGDWILDDLRTESDDALPITLHSSGFFEGDPDVANRWRFADGQIHFRYWNKSGSSPFERWIRGSTVYSLWNGSDEFPLIVEFNEERTLMTLTAPGEEPRARLRRISPELSR